MPNMPNDPSTTTNETPAPSTSAIEAEMQMQIAKLSAEFAQSIDDSMTKTALLHVGLDPQVLETVQMSALMMAVSQRLYRLGVSLEHAQASLGFTMNLVHEMQMAAEAEAKKSG